MDIEDELRDRLCSQNHYFLDDEKAQMVWDLIKKARAAPTKQKARRYLAWLNSLKIQFFYWIFIKNFQKFLKVSQQFVIFVQTAKNEHIRLFIFLKNMLK